MVAQLHAEHQGRRTSQSSALRVENIKRDGAFLVSNKFVDESVILLVLQGSAARGGCGVSSPPARGVSPHQPLPVHSHNKVEPSDQTGSRWRGHERWRNILLSLLRFRPAVENLAHTGVAN